MFLIPGMPLVANNLFLLIITIGYSVGSIQQFVFI
uniref:Uncharacterized protein n=1 Tax=mine drainage metagenome TaxID=410659 RepID=E6Q9U4_9ZZZZ